MGIAALTSPLLDFLATPRTSDDPQKKQKTDDGDEKVSGDGDGSASASVLRGPHPCVVSAARIVAALHGFNSAVCHPDLELLFFHFLHFLLIAF